ncbi:cupin domain-containing protein [Piscinibacter koreensis]|uniref:Cupin domain-containing protein n=1 Tax=Piscinibacter koreensis TaxID=2742824 RepID=A0A7Y6NMW9_9BURK|nr:cupin domain-containing protein [Schlegelella koreensis]NUZ06102.1 cupin domain-containing protein [Schlegelella koreensis]
MADTSSLTDADARRALKADLARFNCRVAQPDDPPLFTREPKPDVQSLHWRGRDLMPLLERLGREVDLGAGGPRRTLRLHNPGLPYGTTNTFWASIQVILPGEVATAHRHSANAFRFVMQGDGAWTTVDGECYPMHEGDLVLTPAGTWHDHVHKGSEPMIWLDVLDISLMRMLQATFFEGYAGSVQPVDAIPDRTLRQFGSGLMRPPNVDVPPGSNPLLAYTRQMAEAALNAAAGLVPDPFDDVVLEYRNPADGGPAMRTLSMLLQRLRPGFEGRARRHTGSKLYYVVRGEGNTTVGEQRFDWSTGDFFTVAPWAWHAHRNAGSGEATLFQVNDTPVLKALGYYREETAAA